MEAARSDETVVTTVTLVRQDGCLFVIRSSQSVRGPLADKELSDVLIRPSRPCATWHKLRLRMFVRFFVDTVRGETQARFKVKTCNTVFPLYIQLQEALF